MVSSLKGRLYLLCLQIWSECEYGLKYKIWMGGLGNIIEFLSVNKYWSSHGEGRSIIYLAGITLQHGQRCGLLLRVVLTKFCCRGLSGGWGYVRGTVCSPSEAKLPFLGPLSRGLVFCLAACHIVSCCAHFTKLSLRPRGLSCRDVEVWRDG